MPKQTHRKLMKMSQLVQRAGVQKATVHFYINQGLLPKPQKTGRNMAYYEESYVERIKLIKELQLKWFLPLNVIRDAISQTDGKLSASELNVIRVGGRFLMQSEECREKYKPQTVEQLSERTGLPGADILKMERYGIISSSSGSRRARVYQDVDIRIVEAFAAIRKSGFTKERGFDVEGFRIHSDLMSMLVVEEVKDFARRTAERFPDDPEFLPRLAEDGLDSINVYLSHLHRKKLLETVQTFVGKGKSVMGRGRRRPLD